MRLYLKYLSVDEQYKPLIEEQLTRYGRLDKALETDKEKLENLRKEVEDLTKLIKFNPFYEVKKFKLAFFRSSGLL